MKPIFMTLCAAAAATAIGLGGTACSHDRENPFTKPYDNEYGIPPFEDIQPADYLPAFEIGLAEAQAAIDSIVNNPEAPTFENTMLPMDCLSPTMERVLGVLFSLTEAHNTPELQQVADEIMPRYTAFTSELMMNQGLFDRVKTLYENIDTVNQPLDERRAIADSYRDFVRSGALLSPEDKERLKEVNATLTNLYLQFNKNLLNANNTFEIVVEDEAELAGIPATTVDNAAAEAKARGKEGKWVFTLHAPSRLAVLQYAQNRGLREKMWRGYTTNATQGDNDNRPVIEKILKARAQKASILGYKDFAAYATADKMAATPEAAEALLTQIFEPAKKKVAQEVAEMQAIADAEGGDFKIAPWDYYYYAEKVRQQKYALDEAALRPYFAVDSVRKGIFTMAQRLYGLNFEEINAPKYHKDVKTYKVTDNDGNHVAIFITDYFTRPEKRQGAWMEQLKASWVNPDGSVERPIVYNVCNFANPTADAPSLLSIDDVQTMFHEFGHGLHAMLSTARLKSQSGTNVDRDFVEFPSQFHEHWAFQPELLAVYAHDYRDGKLIPDSLVQQVNAASKHNMGFMTTELVGAALLDMAWGHYSPAETDSVDVEAFENQVAEKLGMPAELTFRYRSPYFKHIFGDEGYASGYYTYLWAEVLDADAFELFQERGAFDPEAAAAMKKVLQSGASQDPMVLYETFRGHLPQAAALLRQRGLAD